MIARALLSLICLCLAVQPAGAQRLPVDDSLGVFAGVNSRLLWRGLTLADAAGLETGVAVPLRPILRGLQLEVRGWTALASRSRFSDNDQYAGSIHYQLPLRGSPHPASLVWMFTEYLNPNSILPDNLSEELGLTGLYEFGLPQYGVRAIRTELELAKDIGWRKGTWIRGSANASMGTTIDKGETVHVVSAILTMALSASDLSGSPSGQTSSSFGFHSTDLELDLEHRLSGPARAFALSSALRFGAAFRAARIGPHIGWLGLRESLLFF